MRGNPMVNTRLLVVRDDSVGRRRGVKYVGKFVGKRKAFRICLVHVLPPLPPELLEHGGAEDPAKEAQLEDELRVGQHRWISAAKRATQKGLHEDRAVLRKAGISARTVKASFCEPGEGRSEERRVGKECRSRWSP